MFAFHLICSLSAQSQQLSAKVYRATNSWTDQQSSHRSVQFLSALRTSSTASTMASIVRKIISSKKVPKAPAPYKWVWDVTWTATLCWSLRDLFLLQPSRCGRSYGVPVRSPRHGVGIAEAGRRWCPRSNCQGPGESDPAAQGVWVGSRQGRQDHHPAGQHGRLRRGQRRVQER